MQDVEWDQGGISLPSICLCSGSHPTRAAALDPRSSGDISERRVQNNSVPAEAGMMRRRRCSCSILPQPYLNCQCRSDMMGDDAGLAGRHYERMVPCPSGPALDPPCSGETGRGSAVHGASCLTEAGGMLLHKSATLKGKSNVMLTDPVWFVITGQPSHAPCWRHH
ncbi:hypothetical protein AMECASPLE_011526 [Ameca splendens]|uniref:Uncharacterized protein n=1 Tax=Ameca splendens TaxID=208324 RepID=A0ABV0YMW1_9TELE